MKIIKLNIEDVEKIKGNYGNFSSLDPIYDDVNNFYFLPISILDNNEFSTIHNYLKTIEQIDYNEVIILPRGRISSQLPDYNGIKRTYEVIGSPKFCLEIGNEVISIELYVTHENHPELNKNIIISATSGIFEQLYNSVNNGIPFDDVVKFGINISVEDGTIDKRLYKL